MEYSWFVGIIEENLQFGNTLFNKRHDNKSQRILVFLEHQKIMPWVFSIKDNFNRLTYITLKSSGKQSRRIIQQQQDMQMKT